MINVYCDCCISIIKPGERKFVIGITPAIETASATNCSYEESLNQYIHQNRKSAVDIYGFCQACKNIFDYLLTVRQSEIKELKHRFEKIMKTKEIGNNIIKD